MERAGRVAAMLGLAATLLGGCMDGADTGANSAGNAVSRFMSHVPGISGADPVAQGDSAASDTAQKTPKNAHETRDRAAAASPIISALQARRSLLDESSAYGRVAGAVLAASSRAAEADLRSARLRAEAQSKNWLPSIGPNISLSSLGDLVTGIIVEQVLFDNGRRKAEREFAKADVEVAAVTLSDDTNKRIYDALRLYLAAQEGREKAALLADTLKDMTHFEWVMNERVKGGVSNMSDLNVLRHKLAELHAQSAAAEEDTKTALAELNAMSAVPLGDVRGLPAIAVPGGASGQEPLSVLMAEATRDRTIASATIERAASLPGLKATGNTASGVAGLAVTTDKLLGLGTGASLKAIEASKQSASRQVAQAREDAARKLRALEQTSAGLHRQVAEATGLTAQTRQNLDIFQAQYEVGQRQVMDVVGVYETFARQQQHALKLKYDAARADLQIARELGLLANGDDI